MSSNGVVRQRGTVHLIRQRLPTPDVFFSFLSLLSPSIFTMQEDASPQASSSHMMKTTKRGRPFLKVCFSFSYLPSLTLLTSSRTLSTFSQHSLSLFNLQRTSNSFGPSQIPFPRASHAVPSILFEILPHHLSLYLH